MQQSSRRGSISSLSSVSSVLEEKDEDRIRCCRHCMDALYRHQHKLEEKDHVPDIVKLYEVYLISRQGGVKRVNKCSAPLRIL